MLEHFDDYGYIGVFGALLAAGFGFPIPEELPVITAGIMVGHEDTTLRWYFMLPVVIAGVVIGDGVLYAAGRIWGRRLLNLKVIRKRLTAEKQEQIDQQSPSLPDFVDWRDRNQSFEQMALARREDSLSGGRPPSCASLPSSARR